MIFDDIREMIHSNNAQRIAELYVDITEKITQIYKDKIFECTKEEKNIEKNE